MSVLCDLRVDVSSHLLSSAYVIEYKAEKVCHEDMVKMPLVDLKVLEVYTKSKEEHESHLKMNLELLKKEKCHVKPNKEFRHFVSDAWSKVRNACLDEERRLIAYTGARQLEIHDHKSLRDIFNPERIEPEADTMMELLGVLLRRPRPIVERANVVVDAWRRKGGVKPRRAEIGESKMIGLELEQETTKVVVIKERLKEAKDRQES
ncbi:hypothetical protein Tco_0212845 [Tanacetum coccineum]